MNNNSMANEMREEMTLVLSDPLPIGKYKGRKILDIIEEDWSYLNWMQEKQMVILSISIREILDIKKEQEARENEEFIPTQDDLPF